MIIKLTDTFDKIKKYRAENSSFSIEEWRKYADSISPTLYDKCYSDSKEYDFEKQVLPVINDALYNNFICIEDAHIALNKNINLVQEKANAIFDLNMKVEILYYLGLCNGAGWASKLDGKDTVLLGAEKIAELGWHEEKVLIDLVCHELAHLIHFELRSNIPSLMDDSIWQLYTEGFATRYSQRLYKEGFYHQDQDDRLDFCQSNISDIKCEYLRRLNENENTSDFFGDWNTYRGKSNLGYYLGCEFIRWLQVQYNDREIACMLPDDIKHKLFLFLQK